LISVVFGVDVTNSVDGDEGVDDEFANIDNDFVCFPFPFLRTYIIHP
jgi:hypothetical protein